MMRIRQANWIAFEAEAERRFRARVAERLRRHFPEVAGMSDGELDAWIELGRTRAAARGLRSAYHASIYIGLMTELGAGFEAELPWVREILADPSHDSPSALLAVFERASQPPSRSS
jgi:hypothetical protein